jgi:type I restriction enzyme M protein
MDDRDTKGDLYEYMLSKLGSARDQRPVPYPSCCYQNDGEYDRAKLNGDSNDVICDPASGTCGFLMARKNMCAHTIKLR